MWCSRLERFLLNSHCVFSWIFLLSRYHTSQLLLIFYSNLHNVFDKDIG